MVEDLDGGEPIPHTPTGDDDLPKGLGEYSGAFLLAFILDFSRAVLPQREAPSVVFAVDLGVEHEVGLETNLPGLVHDEVTQLQDEVV